LTLLLAPEELAVINAALYDLDQILCIGLFIVPQQSNPSGNYAFIKKGDPGSGCFSEVGNKGIELILIKYLLII